MFPITFFQQLLLIGFPTPWSRNDQLRFRHAKWLVSPVHFRNTLNLFQVGLPCLCNHWNRPRSKLEDGKQSFCGIFHLGGRNPNSINGFRVSHAVFRFSLAFSAHRYCNLAFPSNRLCGRTDGLVNVSSATYKAAISCRNHYICGGLWYFQQD